MIIVSQECSVITVANKIVLKRGLCQISYLGIRPTFYFMSEPANFSKTRFSTFLLKISSTITLYSRYILYKLTVCPYLLRPCDLVLGNPFKTFYQGKHPVVMHKGRVSRGLIIMK